MGFGRSFSLLFSFSGDERLVVVSLVQGVFRRPITPRVLNILEAGKERAHTDSANGR
jgi:hypothetical protein